MSEKTTPTLGQEPPANAGRDAVHVAIVPVVASCPIRPGSHVWLTASGQASWGSREDGNTIGIADPFLCKQIERGQTFWLCLYPNTITSLRHVWTHPAFAPKPPTEETA